MNFEPQKMFVGLVDFFSVIMPGAMLAYIGKDCAARYLGAGPTFPLVDTEAAFVLLFMSYLLGQFVFLFGSMLDDFVYDPLRNCTYWGQIKRLADGYPLSLACFRLIVGWRCLSLFGQKPDAAVMQVERLKALALEPMSSNDTINSFQWCKARLSKEHPEGLLIVQQFEAHSKFFRSFVIVLTILAGVFLIKGVLADPVGDAFVKKEFQFVLICLVAMIPAFWRYVDQRFKATQHAYWLILTLEGNKKTDSDSKPLALKTGSPTHAGGVVLQGKGQDTKVLMVRATEYPYEWVLPKGHIEPGEDPRQSAVREVHEETGVWARVIPIAAGKSTTSAKEKETDPANKKPRSEDPKDVKSDPAVQAAATSVKEIQTLNYIAKGEQVRVQYYFMKAIQDGLPADQCREHKWLSLPEAIEQTKHDDLKNLLKLVGETEV